MTFSIVFNRLYFTEMTFRIVCKRNDIRKCISRKWHSVIVFNRWYFMEMTFRIVFKRNDIQIWFVEGNWNSWIFQFICQSYIIKLNEKSQTRIFKLECEVITQCSDTKRVVFSVQENVWSADSKLLSKKEARLGFQNV